MKTILRNIGCLVFTYIACASNAISNYSDEFYLSSVIGCLWICSISVKSIFVWEIAIKMVICFFHIVHMLINKLCYVSTIFALVNWQNRAHRTISELPDIATNSLITRVLCGSKEKKTVRFVDCIGLTYLTTPIKVIYFFGVDRSARLAQC